MSHPIKRALACSAMAVLLSACGGSGSSNRGIQSPPLLPSASTGVTVNAAAAWLQYLSAPRRWEISGQQNGNAFILALVLTPGPISTFPYNGQLASTTTQSLQLSFAGVATAEIDSTLYYNNDSLIGLVGANGSCAVIRTPFSPLPASSAVGAGGTLVSFDSLAGCSSDAPLGTLTLSWSIEQDLAVTLFCLTSLHHDAGGVFAGSETACVQSNAAGELGGGARLSLRRADGSEVSGKNY